MTPLQRQPLAGWSHIPDGGGPRHPGVRRRHAASVKSSIRRRPTAIHDRVTMPQLAASAREYPSLNATMTASVHENRHQPTMKMGSETNSN
jgi:hypothetical protein